LFLAILVGRHATLVRISINFNDHPVVFAEKIDNVVADWHLAAKLQAVQPMAS
jgi:hypothetical protein